MRIVPGHRGHPGRFGGGELDQIGAAIRRDDEICLEAAAGGLDHHVDTTAYAAATRRIADDPANRIAGSDRHEIFPRLQRDDRHATGAGVDLVERPVRVRPHLDRIDVALARRSHARLGVGLLNALLRTRAPRWRCRRRGRCVRGRRCGLQLIRAAGAAWGLPRPRWASADPVAAAPVRARRARWLAEACARSRSRQ